MCFADIQTRVAPKINTFVQIIFLVGKTVFEPPTLPADGHGFR
jgi:hypothetical protein